MIENKRSLIALDNFMNFALLCADRKRSPNAANQVFLISDGEDVSTTTLLKRVARVYGVKSHLFPVPGNATFYKLLGRNEIADRLFGDLQVDSSKARNFRLGLLLRWMNNFENG